MKNSFTRLQTVTDALLDLNTLREDSLFLSRLLLFQKPVNSTVTSIQTLECTRKTAEGTLIRQVEGCSIDDNHKNLLFSFCTRTYKTIRYFHGKLLSFAPKLAELSDTNAFLQQLRITAIQMLSSHQTISAYLEAFTRILNSRYTHLTKNIQPLKGQEGLRNQKYLELLRGDGVQIVLLCHDSALKQIMTQEGNRVPLSNLYRNVMEISQISNCNLSLNKNEGYCEFVLSRWSRVSKQMKARNSLNYAQIEQYRSSHRDKERSSLKRERRPTLIEPIRSIQRQKIAKSNGFVPTQLQNQESMIPEGGNCCRTILLRKLQVQEKVETRLMSNQQDFNLAHKIYGNPHADRRNFYRIQKLSGGNKSYTLRPLTESQQNNRCVQAVRQTVIQMKIEEKNATSKVIRLRRKRPLLALRQDNIMIDRENRVSKIVMFIE